MPLQSQPYIYIKIFNSRHHLLSLLLTYKSQSSLITFILFAFKDDNIKCHFNHIFNTIIRKKSRWYFADGSILGDNNHSLANS